MTGNPTAVIYINVAAQRLAINFDLIVSSNNYAMTFILDLADHSNAPHVQHGPQQMADLRSVAYKHQIEDPSICTTVRDDGHEMTSSSFDCDG